MGGRGGSGAGTKAWALSASVENVYVSALEFSLQCMVPKIRSAAILTLLDNLK